MEREMANAVKGFMRVRKNPSGDLADDFRVYLLSKGISEPSEDDLTDAALAVGIPEEEVPDFIEEFASRL